ncbi:MAG: segregation and condensation protein A [Candidatus Hydrogenedentota bacterium]|nr:MAG: segregation and condensation protein A [Candidatus Hydrogenedentota bacterium]
MSEAVEILTPPSDEIAVLSEETVEAENIVDGGFIVDEATDNILRLHLHDFQGPMEVLLYLIKSQEIDIFDIPIADITDQYLKFLELMEEENLEVAGDYLVIAATLIQIKSKMLIPMEIDEDDEEIEEEDPRMELVEKLIAYRMYRDMAGRLSGLEEERADWFMRNVKPKASDLKSDDEEIMIEATMFDLALAFKGVLRFLQEDKAHTIEMEESSVDERIEYIQTILDMQNDVAWVDLFKSCRHRVEVVCTFLAILEMCRMNTILCHQEGSFSEIRLYRKVIEAVNVA